MTNIPTIEELDKTGREAAGWRQQEVMDAELRVYLTAIRDAVVAACRPHLHPIAEMPDEVPEGCVRKFTNAHNWGFCSFRAHEDTHYIDIALPVESYPADFEQAFSESKLDAKDKAAAFDLWKKGGAR